ncbi:MAG: hypothetical protein JJU15_16940 [Pararhodobacter sp.]|nr:hypothetical protein [Pararhodobacter sp.]
MRFALFLTLSAVALLAISLAIPGFSDLALMAAVLGLSGAWLLLRWFLRRPRQWVVIDGSNVMHWRDNQPRLDTLREVLALVKARGFVPGVVFDANAGHLIANRYLHDHAFAKLLRLPASQVMVVPKGSPADPTVLAAARDFGARIISNDRFRDWAGAHPEIGQPGYLIRGGYRDGTLWLDL